MRPNTLKELLIGWTLDNSGTEKRKYLGMSSIGDCPAKLYRNYVNGGGDAPYRLKMYSYLGYLFEADIKRRLAGINANMLGDGGEFLDFGGAFQGHSDGTWDGDLLEIKSTTQEYVDRTIREGPPLRHIYQVQAYLEYAGLEWANIIYVARDTGDIEVQPVRREPALAAKVKEKAATILDAAEKMQPPKCTCGYCR